MSGLVRYAKVEGQCPECGESDEVWGLEHDITVDQFTVKQECKKCDTEFTEVYDLKWVDMSAYDNK